MKNYRKADLKVYMNNLVFMPKKEANLLKLHLLPNKFVSCGYCGEKTEGYFREKMCVSVKAKIHTHLWILNSSLLNS